MADIRLGLIGDNIRRSQSPLLHALAGRALRARRQLRAADPRRSRPAISTRCSIAAQAAGFRGVNITYPVKERVFAPVADRRCGESARSAPATVAVRRAGAMRRQHRLLRLHQGIPESFPRHAARACRDGRRGRRRQGDRLCARRAGRRAPAVRSRHREGRGAAMRWPRAAPRCGCMSRVHRGGGGRRRRPRQLHAARHGQHPRHGLSAPRSSPASDGRSTRSIRRSTRPSCAMPRAAGLATDERLRAVSPSGHRRLPDLHRHARSMPASCARRCQRTGRRLPRHEDIHRHGVDQRRPAREARGHRRGRLRRRRDLRERLPDLRRQPARCRPDGARPRARDHPVPAVPRFRGHAGAAARPRPSTAPSANST